VLTVLLVHSRDLECVLASLDDIVVEFVPLGIFKVNISSFDSGCETARISGGINSEIIPLTGNMDFFAYGRARLTL
jgi:hypothetical protein